MAGPITRRLLAVRPGAVRVLIFAQSAGFTADLQQLGALSAASPADLAARSQVVLALLHETDEVEAHLAGPRGLEAGVQSPTTLVIATDYRADVLLDLAARLFVTTAGRLRLVHASMTGSELDIDHGRLSISVGADEVAYEQARHVLEELGRCQRLGDLGSGPAMVAGHPESGAESEPGRASSC